MVEAYTSDVTIPDLFEPNGNGLFDNVVWIDAVSGSHWQGGIQYEANCTDSLVTISACYPDGIAVSGIAEKSATWDKVHRGSKAFTIFQEYDCSPAGMGLTLSDIEKAQELAIKALNETASREAERVLWTGATNNSPAINYPNFITTSEVFDSTGRILLQPSGTMISGAANMDLVEGLGRLEEAASNCYNGRLFIHAPVVLAASLYNQSLITRVSNRWLTANGNRVIFGNGYQSTIGSNGLINAPGVTQMYATSPIFGLRSTPRVFGPVESLDRNVNTFKFIAEQTFLFGWTCCLNGVSVTIGGIEAGAFNNDTAAT